MIFAIGSPLDPFLENTITSGIVSATGRRQLLQMGDVIQIDAPVNPGNSGGPLLNQEGELAGVVFAGFQPYQGLNFAIPIGWLNRVFPRLFQEGEVIHPWLGMALTETEEGLEVIYTVPGEPAMRGGLEPGDALVSINGHRFASIRDLQGFLVDFPVQTLVRLQWTRDGELWSGLFTLQDRPHSPVELALERDRRINLLLPLFGMELKKTGSFLWETSYAVQRVLPGSIADNTGLSKDDPVIVQDWQIDEENRFVVLQLFVKKRNAGFLESVVRLVAYIELDSFV
jgi:hypothetical protein